MQAEKNSGNQPHSNGAAQPPHSFLNPGEGKTKSNAIEVPSVSLPNGGGALKGIDEKFSVNAVNGTAAFSIPLPVSPARGVTPPLSLAYNSGAGNGIFGLGWNLSLSSIKRKTDKQLPQYFDNDESDVFLFAETDDLVPGFDRNDDGSFIKNGDDYVIKERNSPDNLYTIRFYKPRIEGAFARIERWWAKDGSEMKWRVISKENVTTLLGWSANTRLCDPDNTQRVYEWLPEFVFDDKGNCCKYIYKQEDEKGVDPSLIHNKNRLESGAVTYTNLYLEKVLYGNKTPYKQFGDAFPLAGDFLFETIFDYGTVQPADAPDTLNEWDYRPDAFSEYKPGFELRTTRLCKRVLLFHHFTGANEYDGLVRSVNFEYNTSAEQGFTFLQSVTSVGYCKRPDGTYSAKSLPALEFEYQQAEWNSDIKTVSMASLANVPAGIDQPPYQFTDLFNEGLSGILSEQATGWYYKHNLGVRKDEVSGEDQLLFENAKLVSPKPSFGGLGSQLQLADLDGDGGKQLVSYNAMPKGFFELNDDNEWLPFQNFKELPNISFTDPYTRMIDLNGDGKPELLVGDDNTFTWYESAGRQGYAAARKTIKPNDEEAGAHLVFADEKQSIFLADMSGDGLTDLVRIRNGEVCYWPNLGYGRFGKKVAMDGAPHFDHPDAFNPAYIRLSDIDGSGTADIIYLGKNKFSCWMNLNGNGFATTPFEIDPFPEIHSAAKITVTDLLGNGVACIVWSSPLTKDAHSSLKYIDLMNGKKPHIMVQFKNNLGKEVALEYTASTKFYIDDKLAGNPWITKLHFPVHCVSKTIAADKITGHTFTSSYKYHHGYYDHAEREFRGFGMVEQTDAETFEHWERSGATNITDATLHQEPVIAKSWYHTGAFLRNKKILDRFEHEYWYNEMARQGFPVVHHEKPLDDARIIPGKGLDATYIAHLSAAEYQQALRACKNMALRSEVFAHDAIKYGNTTDAIKKQLTPYNVATHNCVIEILQPKGKNRYAVFIVKESEAITYSYEREPEDPRIAHTLNISLDEYGNILESASVVYARSNADATLPAETQTAQNTTSVTYTLINYTGDAFNDNSNRQRLPAETLTWQLKGVAKTGDYYAIADFENILDNSKSDPAFYHEINKAPAAGKALRRLIEHAKTLYYKNDCTGSLPLYGLESKAISFENYQLAYTPELLQNIFGAKVNDALMTEGKFTHSKDALNNDDVNWWVRSGTMQYIEGAETVINAQDRFYVPVSYTEPFGAKTKVTYYGSYFFMIEETEDALANKNTVLAFNFRTLAPKRTKDANDNISEVLIDELGLVKAKAVFGKGNQADELTGLLEQTEAAEAALIQNFFNAPFNPQGVTDSAALINTAAQLLQNATGRFVYDFDVYKNTGKPAVAASILRETHNRDEQGNQNPPSRLHLSFEYSSGAGAVVMKKAQAEPGVAKRVQVMPGNTVVVDEVDTAPLLRWIGNGKTIVNNKGNAVKQYEPYFSISNRYEDFKELVETGVTPVMYYDAAGRLVRTELPNGSFSTIAFNNWKQVTSDANDTVTDSDWYKKRTDNTRPDFITDVKEQQAAAKAALHAGTPSQSHIDPQGRPVLSIAHNKNITTLANEFYHTRIDLDIEGNLLALTDARNNTVMQYKNDLLGNNVYQQSMDAGQRWLLTNILGKPLRTWDERNHEFRFEYDILHRPVQNIVTGGDGSTPLNHIYERIFYGESQPTPELKNLRGQVYQHYDTGGLVEMTDGYDFKGKPVLTKRKLFSKYKEVANWTNASILTDLETDEFIFTTATDALGRITRQVTPDGSIITPSYNETGQLNGETVQHTAPAETITYIKDIDYDEKGQRSKIVYGNDVTTRFTYDKETFRLRRLESKRMNNDPLQDWYYTFDPTGNITHIEDKNIPVTFFDNTKITGISEYTYDALYRLVEATGRENDAALGFGACDNWNDKAFMHSLSNGDPMATRNYRQKYLYDNVGNIMEMRHIATGGNWTRTYTYAAASNRLQSTHIGDNGAPEDYTTYTHHAQHGFLTQLPHLEQIAWNFKEQIVLTTRQHCTPDNIPVTTYYQYDGQGQRIRKITENQASAGGTPTKKEERIYVSGYELYKKYTGANAGLERKSLSLIDQGRRFVMTDTRNDIDDGTGKRVVRYQLHNHLGSASLELNETAVVISYEEYHPYGTTAYQANNNNIKAAFKRYRYTGMERDEETGLEYHSARYYLPWLGRWLSADPVGTADGVNVYMYCHGNPLTSSDTAGTQADDGQTSFYQLPVFQAEVTATYSGRGISVDLRLRMTGIYRLWTGDYNSAVDVGHMGRPFVLLRAGEVSPVGPQLAGENRSDGGGAVRATAATVRAGGGFARVDGIDTSPSGVASRGTRYPTIPLPASLRDPRLVTIGAATGPPVSAPLITLPAPSTPPPTSAPMGQQSFAFMDEPVQLNLFGRRPASPTPSVTTAPTVSAPPPASTQLTLDLEPPPRPSTPPPAPPPAARPATSGGGSTGSSGGGSSSGSGGSSSSSGGGSSRSGGGSSGGGGFSMSSAGTGALRAAGAAVPGVVEAEAVLMSGAGLAASHTATASLAAPLMTAAEAVPVVAGVGVVGAGAGHIARAGASYAGADAQTADTIGFGAAVVTGAALGSFIPGVGTAVGAGIGAIVAGGFYLWSR